MIFSKTEEETEKNKRAQDFCLVRRYKGARKQDPLKQGLKQKIAGRRTV